MDFQWPFDARSLLGALLLTTVCGCGGKPPAPTAEEDATTPAVKVPSSNVKTYENPPPPPP
jgi:hypothetical protein